MKAKIRPENLPRMERIKLDKIAMEYVNQRLMEYDRNIKWRIIKNTLAATCLALSDQHSFGAKRIQRTIDGAIEILEGINEEVYLPKEQEGADANKALDAMLAELEDRGIHIRFTMSGDPADCCRIETKK